MLVDERDCDYFISGKFRVPKKTLKTWLPSSTVTKCHDCKITFGWYVRKHHCRKCGFVFCHSCCHNFSQIPEYVAKPKPDREFNSDERVRVCGKCFVPLLKIIASKFDPEYIVDFSKDWPALVNVSDTQIKYHISKYRDIQYIFPLNDNDYDAYSKIILWHNKDNFVGHICWIVRLILSGEWTLREGEQLEKLFLKTVSTDPIENKVDCSKLLCGRRCGDGFNLEDALMLLSHRVLSDKIKEFCLSTLSRLSVEELKLHLLYIFNASINSASDVIRDWIIDVCAKDVELSLELYWIAKSDCREISTRYIHLLKNKCSDSFVELMNQTLDFVKRDHNIGEVICDPSNGCKKYKIQSIAEINSHTNPRRFLSNDGCGCLVKSESVLKDKIVMNIVRYLSLGAEELKTVTYNVTTTSATSGIIQLVIDSETIASKDSENLFDYIIPSKRDLTLNDAMSNICESLAFYTVLAYTLGIGDRHTENILVKPDGIIFHVDFSYILGETPSSTFGSPKVHVNRALMSIIPKKNSEFIALCKKYFKIFRDNITMLKLFLLPLGLATSFISEFLDKKLMPNMKEASVLELFETMIVTCFNETSLKTIQRDMIDYIHSPDSNGGYLGKVKKQLFG